MAKSTRQEVSEVSMDIMREPLRTSNNPDARRRVGRRRDHTPTKKTQLQVSDDEQEEREEFPPVTADEDDEDDGTTRGLSDDDDDDDNDDGPGTSAKRAKRPDGQPRRVKSEKPPASLPTTKVFERDADGLVQLDSITFVRLFRYLGNIEAPSLLNVLTAHCSVLTATFNRGTWNPVR
jgi:hypothetical protein